MRPPVIRCRIIHGIRKFELHMAFEPQIASKKARGCGMLAEISEPVSGIQRIAAIRDLHTEILAALSQAIVIGVHRESLPNAFIVEVIKYNRFEIALTHE